MAAIQDLRGFLEVLEKNGQLLTSLRKFNSSQTSEPPVAQSPN
jgi:hypothetical protein